MFLSRLLSWCIQRVANLGIVALICLILVAFVWDRPSQEKYDDGKPRRQITNGQLVYVYYTLFVHILGVLFPLRLCWATRSMTKNLKMAIQQPQASPTRASSNFHSRRGSEIGYEDSVASDSSDSIALSTLNENEWDEKPLLHAIILPNYKEDLDTLRETLDVLACHPQASSSYEVGLHQLSSWKFSCRIANFRLFFCRFTLPWNRVNLAARIKLQFLLKNMMRDSALLNTHCTLEIFQAKRKEKAAT